MSEWKKVKLGDLSNAFLYCAMRYGGISEMISPLANGVNVLHLKPEAMMGLEMMVPSKEIVNIKSLSSEYCREELDEMKEIAHAGMRRGKVDWHEYVTYTRLDVHPDPEGAKMGRPI